MTTEHYIHYYDRFGTVQKAKISDVFSMWVKSKGGNRQFLEYIYRKNSITFTMEEFFRFFMQTFDGEIVIDSNVVEQGHVFDPELYRMYLKRVQNEYDNRAFSPQSVFTIIVLALAVIGLVKLCS